MKRTIPELKAKLANVIKPGIPAGIRALNHNSLLVDIIDSLQNEANDLRSMTQTFIVRAVMPGEDISFTLLNDIAENTFVIVSNKNFRFDDSDITYHCNSISVTEKNKVNLLIAPIYFDIDYKIGEKFLVSYWYNDAAPVDPSIPENVIYLQSITHEVINNTQVSISIFVINLSNTDYDVGLYLELINFSKKQHAVRTVPANSWITIDYIYDLVPEGTYTFSVTGMLSGILENIVIEPKAPTIRSGFIIKSRVRDDLKFSIELSNTGSASMSAAVLWKAYLLPDKTLLDEFLTVSHTIYAGQSRTYYAVFQELPPGNLSMEASLNDTVLQVLNFTV
jgi:hypothetical protein